MKKRQKMWIYCSRKQPVSDLLKAEVQVRSIELVENVIKPEHVKPSLCVTCKKDDNLKKEILCILTRADQQDEVEFICYAYERKKNSKNDVC